MPCTLNERSSDFIGCGNNAAGDNRDRLVNDGKVHMVYECPSSTGTAVRNIFSLRKHALANNLWLANDNQEGRRKQLDSVPSLEHCACAV